ncbi:MAG: serine protease [Anaerolineae bacterium]|nr:MAG: serine protease [Anaerolineae bacterium]
MATSASRKLLILISVLLLAALACSAAAETPGSPTSAPAATTAANAIPYEAVVQIWAMAYDANGTLQPSWTGSGSIITPDGFILTNAHVVLPDRYYPVDALIIAMTTSEDRPPEPRYYAQVYQADVALDIAVVRVISDLNSNPVDYGNLKLPYVPLGDPAGLSLGDAITIIGYPGIGGETVTLTRGEVSGFTSEAPYGDRAFIKTSATIAGGNSGGMAADSNGLLVGIPTQLGYGGDDQFVDCRVLADTNRDGFVDENDDCVPTGGFINALRPINLALPLIAAARNGQINIASAPPPAPSSGGGGGNDLHGDGAVLMEDDFSNANSGWPDDSGTGNGSARYINGEYHINVIPTEYYIWATPDLFEANIIMSVDVRFVDPVGDADYGFICRYVDNDNFYGLELTEDGFFAIWRYLNGEYTALVDWETSDEVPTGSGVRTITAACIDDYLGLAVNGVVVAETEDSALTSGDIGLIAGTWDNGNVTISFDNLIVTEP